MRRIRIFALGIVSFFAVLMGALLAPGTFVNRALSAALCTVFSFSSTVCTVNLAKSSERVVAATPPTVERNISDWLVQRDPGEFDDAPSAPPGSNPQAPPFPQDPGPNQPVRPDFDNRDQNPVNPAAPSNNISLQELTGTFITSYYADSSPESLFYWTPVKVTETEEGLVAEFCDEDCVNGYKLSPNVKHLPLQETTIIEDEGLIVETAESQDGAAVWGEIKDKDSGEAIYFMSEKIADGKAISTRSNRPVASSLLRLKTVQSKAIFATRSNFIQVDNTIQPGNQNIPSTQKQQPLAKTGNLSNNGKLNELTKNAPRIDEFKFTNNNTPGQPTLQTDTNQQLKNNQQVRSPQSSTGTNSGSSQSDQEQLDRQKLAEAELKQKERLNQNPSNKPSPSVQEKLRKIGGNNPCPQARAEIKSVGVKVLSASHNLSEIASPASQISSIKVGANIFCPPSNLSKIATRASRSLSKSSKLLGLIARGSRLALRVAGRFAVPLMIADLAFTAYEYCRDNPTVCKSIRDRIARALFPDSSQQTAQQPQQTASVVTARISQVDDVARIYVDGKIVFEGFYAYGGKGGDTGWQPINVGSGRHQVRLVVENTYTGESGGWFEIKVNGELKINQGRPFQKDQITGTKYDQTTTLEVP
ncbi:MAG: hypothetical protein U1V55_11075 [Planktothrix rubescens PR222]